MIVRLYAYLNAAIRFAELSVDMELFYCIINLLLPLLVFLHDLS
jgi:hypothetical protein